MLINQLLCKVVSGLLIMALVAVYFFRKGKLESVKEQQEQQIEIQHGTIETKNFQQKLISKPQRSIDIAARDEWLQLLWEKADNN